MAVTVATPSARSKTARHAPQAMSKPPPRRRRMRRVRCGEGSRRRISVMRPSNSTPHCSASQASCSRASGATATVVAPRAASAAMNSPHQPVPESGKLS